MTEPTTSVSWPALAAASLLCEEPLAETTVQSGREEDRALGFPKLPGSSLPFPHDATIHVSGLLSSLLDSFFFFIQRALILIFLFFQW